MAFYKVYRMVLDSLSIDDTAKETLPNGVTRDAGFAEFEGGISTSPKKVFGDHNSTSRGGENWIAAVNYTIKLVEDDMNKVKSKYAPKYAQLDFRDQSSNTVAEHLGLLGSAFEKVLTFGACWAYFGTVFVPSPDEIIEDSFDEFELNDEQSPEDEQAFLDYLDEMGMSHNRKPDLGTPMSAYIVVEHHTMDDDPDTVQVNEKRFFDGLDYYELREHYEKSRGLTSSGKSYAKYNDSPAAYYVILYRDYYDSAVLTLILTDQEDADSGDAISHLQIPAYQKYFDEETARMNYEKYKELIKLPQSKRELLGADVEIVEFIDDFRQDQDVETYELL